MPTLRLALAALLLPAALQPSPTHPSPQQPELPTIKVDTKLTIVDVTVTDKNGRPVHGLKPEDFVIKEDGKPQPIKNFDEYGADNTQPGPSLPPGVYSNQSAPTNTPPTNLILLDDVVMGGVHADPSFIMYSRQQAQHYIENLPANTPVAILENAEKLILIQPVTTDRSLLLAAISKVVFKPIPGITLLFPPSHTQAEHIASFTGQARLTFNALNALAAYASTIPGRKNLLWLTPGIPWLTNPAKFTTTAGITNLEVKLQQLYGLFNAAKVAIYTIDSAGLTGIFNADGDINLTSTFLANADRRDSLQAFAEATGGKAYFNRNDLDAALAEAVSTGSDYYAISYTPPLQRYDGKFHTIDVKISRPGLQLQYQKGYTSLDLADLNKTVEKLGGKPATAVDLPAAVAQFRKQMDHGAPFSRELNFTARITPSPATAKPAPPPVKGDLNPRLTATRLTRYDIAYSLPAGQITVAEDTGKVSVELDVVAYAEDGTKLNVLRQTANINLKPEQVTSFQQKPLDLSLQLDLPPGNAFLRVGILDIPSGKTGTLEATQASPAP